jgi:glycosidase
MGFRETVLAEARPASLGDFTLPRREAYFPSPADWRNEVLYFLLPDRFSDGKEGGRPRLDRSQLSLARPAIGGGPWRWDLWAESGSERWQGGTIEGIRSKIGYLRRLGITAVWIGPVFKQRGHLDSYHGYGVQDFLDVDPRFGTREDLVDLVSAAHAAGIRVILDIIFNHSGENWTYPPETPGGPHTPRYTSGRYPFGAWRGQDGAPIGDPMGDDAAVWPREFQDAGLYTRAGSGDLGAGDLQDPDAEHKRTDFITLRDFRLTGSRALDALARSYKYWIALTDCDGFRIDTLKHVTFEEARNFCGTVKEFAANLGKHAFFLVGEVAGGEFAQRRYLEALDRNLDAVLDIGEMRLALRDVAKGLRAPQDYFSGFDPGDVRMGSHRNVGLRHVSILDDHDHVFGEKVRFSAEASAEHQVVAGVALQLFTLGIPCIYYGTEQSLGGPEAEERRWLPGWKSSDRYLREAMFGPENPRRRGREGLATGDAGRDSTLPGFGPFGTAGHHAFDEESPAFRRIRALNAVRAKYPVLRVGRQYPRGISFLGRPFDHWGPGEIVGWSRILDDEEALCVLNSHGRDSRGADVIVDSALNAPGGAGLTVVANTAQAALANPSSYVGPHPVGSRAAVGRKADGTAFVEIRDMPACEFLVLMTHR